MNPPLTIAREFERESHRIDQLIWDAMALRAGESVLFCGFANSIEWIKRAVAIDVSVSVVSADAAAIREFDDLPITIVRGSTSMLPVGTDAFDATIAFHYLHEVDPFFHAGVVLELARVGRRTVIVEPAPPSDPLGSRIASLYSRVKRDLGQFENYHHMEYWKKLLALAKPEVHCQTFTYMRTPPPEAIKDTVTLVIDMMAAEQTPQTYLTELRALAARPNARLIPQSRLVIVGQSDPLDRSIQTTAGTSFRAELPNEPKEPATAFEAFVPPAVSVRPAPGASASAQFGSTVYTHPETTSEYPAVPLPKPAHASAAASASQIARNAFGLSSDIERVVPESHVWPARSVADEADDAFGVAEHNASESPADFGWAWEPPDETDKI